MSNMPPYNEPKVTVWKINLHHLNPDMSYYSQILSGQEIEKSKRYYFEKDQRRYVQSHAILRIILGKILGESPASIQFVLNPYGKPYVNHLEGKADIYFNLSHSLAGVLIAVSQGIECGVDIEFQKEDFPSKEIAEHFFSENEIRAYLALPPEQQKEAFFNCWTRKEAYIKAKGKGLNIPLDSFDVSLAPNEPARLLQSRLEPDDIEQWSLVHLESWDQYSSALCANSKKFSYGIEEWG
jgi:4'-phosphopantetheinyl transferase